MDIRTSLIAILESIHKEISQVGQRLESIKKVLADNHATRDDERERENNCQILQNIRNGDPMKVRAEVRPDETTKQDSKTENESQRRIQRHIRNATIGAVIAATSYAFISMLQVCELRTQTAKLETAANAAVDNNKITRAQFIADQRPWIALDSGDKNAISFYAPLVIDTRRSLINQYGELYRQNADQTPASNESALGDDTPFAIFDLGYRIKNFGHSPAKVDVEAIVENDKAGFLHGRRLVQAVDRMCSIDARQKHESTKFLWPCTLPPGSMHFDKNAFWLRATAVRTLTPTIVGCIWYQYTSGDDTRTVHATPFSAHISTTTGEGGRESLDVSPLAIPVRRIPVRFELNDIRVVDVLTQGNPD